MGLNAVIDVLDVIKMDAKSLCFGAGDIRYLTLTMGYVIKVTGPPYKPQGSIF